MGHQTYGHKILTGRRAGMARLRQKGGIAGFPRREESRLRHLRHRALLDLDLGRARHGRGGAEHLGATRRAIAVIGDGAMTAGMAFEALNNAKQSGANVIVVLNDNDMSISENVGALNNYLAQAHVGALLRGDQEDRREDPARSSPPMKELAKRFEEHAKGMLTPSTLFEEFGFNYTGPIDGHNLDVLVDTLHQREAPRRPAVPARGHAARARATRFAEDDPITYHGPGKFDPGVGLVKPAPAPDARPRPTYTQVFGDWLCDMARARHAPGRHHAGDARRLGPGAASRRSSRIATSTSASPSSTRSPSPRASRATA